MVSIKKGALVSTPNLSNYRSTGESFPTKQRYKNQTFFESFLNQFNSADRRFYTDAVIELSKNLK